MDTQNDAVLRGLPAPGVRQGVERAFRGYAGCLGVRLWNGDSFTLGQGSPGVTLVFNTAKSFRDLVLHHDPLRVAEAYFLGEIDVEGDFHALISQRDHLRTVGFSLGDRMALLAAALRLTRHAQPASRGPHLARWSRELRASLARAGSRALAREAISFHYDVSNDFYRLWLDEQMVYSCAYFEHPDTGLEEAQHAKLDHICRKLRLMPGERLLDIGCGWGALVIHAAQRYGVQAHGITLSRQQLDCAQARIRELGLQDRVRVELRDYRDLAGEPPYDKVSSVGMFEHVGIRNLPVYFGAVHRALKPGGLFLNHGITNDVENRRKYPTAKFLRRYVFPEGELDTVSNVQHSMERAQLEILDVEGLRAHYAMTLRHWVARLEANRERAVAEVGEARYRVWRLYMAVSAVQFEQGATGVYQILAASRRDEMPAVPLTRRELYAGNAGNTA